MDNAGPYESYIPNIQEIIYYGASQLRAILNVYRMEDIPSIRQWKQNFYQKELVLKV